MIALYAIGLTVLGVAAFLTGRRARRLERKYVETAKHAERLAHDLTLKNGNRNHLDPCVQARKQYELGQVVAQRDRLEAKYGVWESRRERLARTRDRLRNWRGRKAPYVMGVVDTALVLGTLIALGVVQFDARELVEKVRAVVSK